MAYNPNDYYQDPHRNERDPSIDPVVDYTTEQLFEEGIILKKDVERKDGSYEPNSALQKRSQASWAGHITPQMEYTLPAPKAGEPIVIGPAEGSTMVEDVDTHLPTDDQEPQEGEQEAEVSEETIPVQKSPTIPIPKPDIPRRQPRHNGGDLEDTVLLDDPEFQPRRASTYNESVAVAKAMLEHQERRSQLPTEPMPTAEDVSEDTVVVPTPKQPLHRVSEETSPIIKPKGNSLHRGKTPRFRLGDAPPQV